MPTLHSVPGSWFSDHHICLLRLRVCVLQRLSAIKVHLELEFVICKCVNYAVTRCACLPSITKFWSICLIFSNIIKAANTKILQRKGHPTIPWSVVDFCLSVSIHSLHRRMWEPARTERNSTNQQLSSALCMYLMTGICCELYSYYKKDQWYQLRKINKQVMFTIFTFSVCVKGDGIR